MLIAAAVGLFFAFINPTYSEVKTLRDQQKEYDEALLNSRKLLEKRDELTQIFNSFSLEDKDRLLKLMPDNVDNIRLVLDVQRIAKQYGMLPRDIKFDTGTRSGGASAIQQTGSAQALTPDQVNQAKKDFGSFDLEFSVIGTYENFVNFLRDLEKSLRVVDITSVTFGVGDDGKTALRFTVKTKTYWLRN